jgi:hypothetical protein
MKRMKFISLYNTRIKEAPQAMINQKLSKTQTNIDLVPRVK